MPSLKHTEITDPTSIPNTIVAKIGNLVFLSLFLFMLYTQEKTAMIYISENLSTPDQFLINSYLHRLTGYFLPGQFWRLFWALSIVAAAMIFFDKWRWYFLAAAGLFSALILIANMIYYDFYASVITVASLSIADHLPGVWSYITRLFRTNYILMILMYLTFVIVGIFFNKYHDASLNRNLPSFVIDKVIGIACALLAFYSFSIGFHLDTKEALYKKINGQPKLFIFSKNDPASAKDKHDLIAPRYLTSPRGYALTFGMFNFYVKDMIDSFMDTPTAPPERRHRQKDGSTAGSKVSRKREDALYRQPGIDCIPILHYSTIPLGRVTAQPTFSDPRRRDRRLARRTGISG